jgi:hypothetical protein
LSPVFTVPEKGYNTKSYYNLQEIMHSNNCQKSDIIIENDL